MTNNVVINSSTSELELLEFKIGGNCYGVNVSKIKEILTYQKITPVPNSHPCVEGIFMPRDMLITLVDLAKALGLPPSSKPQNDMFIITKFNLLTIAFHVHSVEGIHRISWKDINKPDNTINDENSVSTGIVKIDGRLIIILDFEKILSDICPETGLKSSDIDKLGERERREQHLLMIDDSMLLSKQISDCLYRAGYSNISTAHNGQEAWNLLQKYKEEGKAGEIKCVITDIEMPVMDGMHLISLIRGDSAYEKVPIVVFSSLSGDEMRKQGEQLGANAYLSKPEMGSLVETIDNLVQN